MARLILLCGLPASGKTRLARQLETTRGAIRLSLDEWVVALGLHGQEAQVGTAISSIQQDLALRLIQLGATVVLDNGFTTKRRRDDLRDAARSCGAAIELRVLDAPLDELEQRLIARNECPTETDVVVDPKSLGDRDAQFERPTPSELHAYDAPVARGELAPRGPGRLILLCGLPAAGKTTLARELEATRSAVRLSPDEWMIDLGVGRDDHAGRDRIEGLLGRLAIRLVETGLTLVLENGFWGRSERDALRAAARESGAAVELHVLDPARDVLLRRVASRNAALPPGTFIIDPTRYDAWDAVFERPDADELALFDPPPSDGLR